jgi:hypothetical protein
MRTWHMLRHYYKAQILFFFLHKLTIAQLLEKFPALYGTPRSMRKIPPMVCVRNQIHLPFIARLCFYQVHFNFVLQHCSSNSEASRCAKLYGLRHSQSSLISTLFWNPSISARLFGRPHTGIRQHTMSVTWRKERSTVETNEIMKTAAHRSESWCWRQLHADESRMKKDCVFCLMSWYLSWRSWCAAAHRRH